MDKVHSGAFETPDSAGFMRTTGLSDLPGFKKTGGSNDTGAISAFRSAAKFRRPWRSSGRAKTCRRFCGVAGTGGRCRHPRLLESIDPTGLLDMLTRRINDQPFEKVDSEMVERGDFEHGRPSNPFGNGNTARGYCLADPRVRVLALGVGCVVPRNGVATC